eukprot:8854095-Pyramimonas_sp.AAC.1
MKSGCQCKRNRHAHHNANGNAARKADRHAHPSASFPPPSSSLPPAGRCSTRQCHQAYTRSGGAIFCSPPAI